MLSPSRHGALRNTNSMQQTAVDPLGNAVDIIEQRATPSVEEALAAGMGQGLEAQPDAVAHADGE